MAGRLGGTHVQVTCAARLRCRLQRGCSQPPWAARRVGRGRAHHLLLHLLGALVEQGVIPHKGVVRVVHAPALLLLVPLPLCLRARAACLGPHALLWSVNLSAWPGPEQVTLVGLAAGSRAGAACEPGSVLQACGSVHPPWLRASAGLACARQAPCSLPHLPRPACVPSPPGTPCAQAQEAARTCSSTAASSWSSTLWVWPPGSVGLWSPSRATPGGPAPGFLFQDADSQEGVSAGLSSPSNLIRERCLPVPPAHTQAL